MAAFVMGVGVMPGAGAFAAASRARRGSPSVGASARGFGNVARHPVAEARSLSVPGRRGGGVSSGGGVAGAGAVKAWGSTPVGPGWLGRGGVLRLRLHRAASDVQRRRASAAASGDDSSSDASSSNTSDTKSKDGPTSTSAADADAADANTEEVVGVEVTPPSGGVLGPSGASAGGGNDDKKQKANDKGKKNPLTGFLVWFRAMFQPRKLMVLMIQTLFFFYACTFFSNTTANQGGARHVTHIVYNPRCLVSLVKCLHVVASDLAWRASCGGPCSECPRCPPPTAASSPRQGLAVSLAI